MISGVKNLVYTGVGMAVEMGQGVGVLPSWGGNGNGNRNGNGDEKLNKDGSMVISAGGPGDGYDETNRGVEEKDGSFSTVDSSTRGPSALSLVGAPPPLSEEDSTTAAAVTTTGNSTSNTMTNQSLIPANQAHPSLSLLHTRLSNSPPLLPSSLASLITSLSLAARVSLRSSALLIEVILESSSYGTSAGLGLTRRTLIAAVGSAVRFQRALGGIAGSGNERENWDGDEGEGPVNVGTSDLEGKAREVAKLDGNDHSFLQVLDRYTNLGIYMIHHTFTMVELFAMSGFYLTSSSIGFGFQAAEESVRMLDSLFGSNETSRALSSFITLVRSQLSSTSHPRFSSTIGGGSNSSFSTIRQMSALTKALTAWACLQNATHRRRVREMKMRVLYDCTVVKKKGESGSTSIGTSGSRSMRSRTASSVDMRGHGHAHAHNHHHHRASADATATKRGGDMGGIGFGASAGSGLGWDNGGGGNGDVSPPADDFEEIRRETNGDDDLLMTDVRSAMEQGRTWQDDVVPFPSTTIGRRSKGHSPAQSFSASKSVPNTPPGSKADGLLPEESEDQQGVGGDPLESEEQEIVYELGQMIGDDGAEEEELLDNDGDGDGKAQGVRKKRLRKNEGEIPEQVRKALLQLEEGKEPTAESLEVIGRRSGNVAGDDGSEGLGEGRKRMTATMVKVPRYDAYYEVETTTTIQTTKTVVRSVTSESGASYSNSHHHNSIDISPSAEKTSPPPRPPYIRSTSGPPIRQKGRRSVLGGGLRPLSTISAAPTNATTNTSSSYDKRSISSHSRTNSAMRELFEQDEWVEIASRFDGGSRVISEGGLASAPSSRNHSRQTSDSSLFPSSASIPEVENGRPPMSMAQLSRQETIDDPEQSKAKLEVVLKTMTKKLTSRKKTVRRVSSHLGESDSSGASPIMNPTSPAKDPPEVTKDSSSPQRVSLPSTLDKPAKPKSFKNAIDRAKTSLSPKASFHQGEHRKHSKGKDSSLYASPPAPRPSSVPHTPVSNGPSPVASTSKDTLDSIPPSTNPTPPSHPVNFPTGGSSPRTRRKSRRRSPTTSMHSTFTTRTRYETTSKGSRDEEPKPTNFPRAHLVGNIQRFMKYSSAAYGQHFMRILGIGSMPETAFPSTQTHHGNHHAFAYHCRLPLDAILLSSYSESSGFGNDKLSPLVHYVAVDHAIKAIVLTCRGTIGLSDILVDLICDYDTIAVEGGEETASYKVHSGMYHSALVLKHGTLHDVLANALRDYPDYGLVLCGHSLGGGCASLLSILWSSPAKCFRQQAAKHYLSTGTQVSHPEITTPFVTSFASNLPPGRPIHCYAYGPPCVASLDLARYTCGLITSVCHNWDVVPTLSLGLFSDLKTIAVNLYEEGNMAEEIVGRVVGLYQRQFRQPPPPPPPAASPSATAPSKPQDPDPSPALTDLDASAKEVSLTESEIRSGRGNNMALLPAYSDPAMTQTSAETEDPELHNWFWSLMNTLRASNDAEKLYPPGRSYVVEQYECFFSSRGESKDPSNLSSFGEHGKGSKNLERQEGRRVILREVEDVEARFSEPVFTKRMFHDHSPYAYEVACDILCQAALPDNSVRR